MHSSRKVAYDAQNLAHYHVSSFGLATSGTMANIGLIVYLVLWYAGNYYYNIFNKKSAKASGGADFAFTLATMQLVIGSIYALFLWLAPEARKRPTVPFAPHAHPPWPTAYCS